MCCSWIPFWLLTARSGNNGPSTQNLPALACLATLKDYLLHCCTSQASYRRTWRSSCCIHLTGLLECCQAKHPCYSTCFCSRCAGWRLQVPRGHSGMLRQKFPVLQSVYRQLYAGLLSAVANLCLYSSQGGLHHLILHQESSSVGSRGVEATAAWLFIVPDILC